MEPTNPSLQLHRVRFVDWSPSPITALAVSPVPPAASKASQRGILAIGRDNGNIDLCVWVEDSPEEQGTSGHAKGWQVETTLPGLVPSKIDSLAFTYAPTSLDGPSALRLFSTSGGSLLTEHFLPSALASAGTSNSFLSRALNTDANASLAGTTRTLGSLGGAIWSLAASPLGRTLAIGCEDGYVRMVDISDGKFEHLTASQRRGPDGRVQGQVSRMGRITSRVLSLAWGPLKRVSTSSSKQQSEEDSSDDDSDEDDADLWEDSFLLGGCADSAARVWDVVSGRVQDKLTVAKVRGEQTIVWSCAVLRDGTPVLGDSLGRVTFYDARTRVPLPAASFKAHGADVLTLAVGPDGKALYSAGVDQKVAEYALVGGAGGVQKWVNTAARRLHAHDIRALALDPPFDIRRSDAAPTRLPILASGGTDYTLVLTPASPPSAVQHRAHAAPGSRKAGKFAPAPPKDLANPISSNPLTSFADTTQRRLPFVPGSTRGGAASNVAQLCAAKGWIVCRRERSVGIWAIKPQAEREEEGLSDEDSVEDGWNKLLEMELKVRTNLISSAISADGRWLAVSDLYETKLFSLTSSDPSSVSPRRVKSLTSALPGGTGASALSFTPDSGRLVICTAAGAFVHVLELPDEGATGNVRLLRSFAQHRARGAARALAGRVAAHEASANGRTQSQSDEEDEQESESSQNAKREVYTQIVCATVSPDGQWLVTVDLSRRVHVFNLDALQHDRTLPSPPHVPSSAIFHPTHPSLLTLILPTNRLQFYDLESPRGQSNQPGNWMSELSSYIQLRLSTLREGVVGASWLLADSTRAAMDGEQPRADALILWGPTWLCTARLRQSISSLRSSLAPNSRTQENLPKRGRSETNGTGNAMDMDLDPTPDAELSRTENASGLNVRLTHKYQPLLLVDVMPPSASASDSPSQDGAQLVVVERPFFALAKGLPPAYYRGSRYGM